MNNDRVAEAYLGDLGEGFQTSTRKRCHWIVEQVQGDEVLDIGCSQGIISYLVAKNGASVTGIDNEEPAISYAERYVHENKDAMPGSLRFICGDFLITDLEDKHFDTIIMSEILEHVNEPNSFIDKAIELLAVGGRLVITVPFGISPHPDHKRTYYFTELYRELSERLVVSEMCILGDWIGFVCSNAKNAAPLVLGLDVVKALESACIDIDERRYELWEKTQHLYSVINNKDQGIQMAQEDKIKLREELAALVQSRSEINDKYWEAARSLNSLRSDLAQAEKRMRADKDAHKKELAQLEEKCASEREIYDNELLAMSQELDDMSRSLNEASRSLEYAKHECKIANEHLAKYKHEYESLVGSRGIKIWMRLRRLMGKPYVPYKTL